MTQEEKSLLLQDLCARFPYGVKLHVHWEFDGAVPVDSVVPLSYDNLAEMLRAAMKDGIIYEQYVVKPYLRSLSNMTDKEKEEFMALFDDSWSIEPTIQSLKFALRSISNVNDWLNQHRFDYRGLIEKDLAIEAPEGMYNKKEGNT